MIVVTGGAGFIGSNLISALNAADENEIILVDDLTDTAKIPNINDLRVSDYLDKEDFRNVLRKSGLQWASRRYFTKGPVRIPWSVTDDT